MRVSENATKFNPFTWEFIWNKPVFYEDTRPAQLRGCLAPLLHSLHTFMYEYVYLYGYGFNLLPINELLLQKPKIGKCT